MAARGTPRRKTGAISAASAGVASERAREGLVVEVERLKVEEENIVTVKTASGKPSSRARSRVRTSTGNQGDKENRSGDREKSWCQG